MHFGEEAKSAFMLAVPDHMQVDRHRMWKSSGSRALSGSLSSRLKGRVIFQNWSAWPFIIFNQRATRIEPQLKSGLKHARYARRISTSRMSCAIFPDSGE